MKQWASVVVIVVCAGVLGIAQVNEVSVAPSVTVTGQAVSGADGWPLVGVHISIPATSDAPALTALTDTAGRFTLTVPTAPRYQLTARKAGFLIRVVTVTAGEPVLLRLDQRAVLAGRVVDDAGEPVVEAQVTTTGQDGVVVETGTTDDRGDYRLSVPADRPLVLSVTTAGIGTWTAMGSGRLALDRATPTVVYFPGTDVAQRATALQLRPGEERQSLDFVVSTEHTMRQPFRGLDAIPILGARVDPGDPTEIAPGVIRGRIVDGDARGLGNALIVLTNERGGSSLRLERSDATGEFEFRQVPAGWFRVTASKPGYAPDDARPALSVGQSRPVDVPLRLRPLAAISGRVVNEFGEPVQRARVQVMAMRYTSGRPVPALVASVDPFTDDRGMYRVHGLEPGAYVISAELADAAGDGARYWRSYFGSAGPTEATLVEVSSGQELGNVEVRLRQWPAFRVTGRVLDPTGQPAMRGTVTLLPSRRSGATVRLPVSATMDSDGHFEFTGVPSGEYVVQAYQGRVNGTTEGEFGAVGLTVGSANVIDLVLPMSSGSSISGQVVVDSADPFSRPSRGGVEMTPIPADLDLAPDNWPRAGITADWRFSFAGISGARRLIPTRVPDGWAVKAIRVNGVEVGDRPLPFGAANQSVSDVEVVLTDRPSELRGRVTDPGGQGSAGVSVAVFSPERDHWYPFSRHLRRVTTRADGSFIVGGLPPSGYYVAVLAPRADAGSTDWQDPAVLESLISRASFVTLNDAQSISVQLRR